MRKKILDAAILTALCMSLFVTSNIQGRASDAQVVIEISKEEESSLPIEAQSEDLLSPSAGICLVISANSFTTESDEETGIEKKDVTLVTSSSDSNGENEEISEEVELDTEFSSNVQTVETVDVPEETIYENRWNISLTEEEIDLLAKIVWLEASGEPVEGQEAVVEVVFNRMASDLYPETLYDVLSQNKPVQFSSWKNRDKAHPTETEYQSIYNVLNGNTNLLRNDTMNFSTFMLTPNLDVKICCHYFCY